MKCLVDQQLPPALADWLLRQGESAVHVRDIGLRDATDSEVWAHALRNEMAIVSKDEDFASWRSRTQVGPVIVWLRIGNATNPELLAWISQRWPDVREAVACGAPIVEVR